MKRITANWVLSFSEGEFCERQKFIVLSDLKTLDDLFTDPAD
jgi:hypothetical protein